MSKVFLNGEIVDSDKALVSANDTGLLYGAGIFETMRCVNGKVFAVEDHMDRLFAGIEALSINCPDNRQHLTRSIYKVLKANEIENARVRLTITNGTVGVEDAEPTVLITATDFAPYPKDYYEKGVLVTLTETRHNITDPTACHKTTNFYPRLMALNDAHKKGAVEALWFTTDNRLAEGSISNVFLVKDSKIYTPGLDTAILPGVARSKVIEIAKAQGIELEEKDLFIKDLLGADEVFVTNVIMTALPVVGIEAHTVSQGKVGPITKQISECFNEMLA